MNTRLQVEHPVTECITGLDLVEWQLRVAAGEPLPLAQDADPLQRPCHRGTPVCRRPVRRLQAADRAHRWLAARRRALHARGVRIDHGIAEGGEVTPFYDAMVAKVIAHGRDRADAVRRLGARAGRRAAARPAQQRPLPARPAAPSEVRRGADDDDAARRMGAPAASRCCSARPPDEDAWRIAAAVLRARRRHRAAAAQAWRPSTCTAATCDGVRAHRMRAPAAEGVAVAVAGPTASCAVDVDGVQRRCVCVDDGADAAPGARRRRASRFTEPSPYPAARRGADATPRPRARGRRRGPGAAWHAGDAVVAGQPLVCVEAMKMEMWLHAAAAGTVQARARRGRATGGRRRRCWSNWRSRN